MMKYIIFYGILLCNAAKGFSQESYKLSGKVTDSTGKPLESGDAILLRQNDSTLIKASMITNGDFNFKSIGKGSYLLKISCIGFHNEFRPVSLNEDTRLSFVLKMKATSLQAVDVSHATPIFTTHAGNFTMNIENTIFSSVPDVMDLLAKLPGIQLSSDRRAVTSVEARSEPLIYIDNQRVSVYDLNALSVRDIKSIEVVNNPSSKYDAAGRMVILISRKINQIAGYKVDLSEIASFKRRYNNYSGINASYKEGKLEFRGNFQYNRLQPWEGNSTMFSIDSGHTQANYTGISVVKGNQFQFGGGMYDQINESDYFSLNVTGNVRNDAGPINTNSYIQTDSGSNNILTTATNDRSRFFMSSSANYNKRLKRLKGGLFLAGQYSSYTEGLYTSVFNDSNFHENDFSQYRRQQTKIDAYAGKADFDKEFDNGMKWEAGASVSKASSRANLYVQDITPPDTTTSQYNYSEWNYAAYSQISGKIRKITYSAGLRVEDTRIRGGFSDSSSLLINQNPTYLYPKASIVVPLDSNSSLTFVYARSGIRPNYSSLSQITIYINPFTLYSRNINLEPTLTNEYSVKYQVKNIFFRLTYYSQSDPVYFGTTYNSQTGIVTIMDRNYNRESGLTLSVSVPIKYKFWSSNNSLIPNFTSIKDPGVVLNQPHPSLYVYSGNQFALTNGYSFMFTAWYLTKRYTGLYERGSLSKVDLGVVKTYKRLTCTIMWNDIFRTLENRQVFNITPVTSSQIYYEDIKELAISFKYSFGEMRKSSYKNVNVDANMDRVK